MSIIVYTILNALKGLSKQIIPQSLRFSDDVFTSLDAAMPSCDFHFTPSISSFFSSIRPTDYSLALIVLRSSTEHKPHHMILKP